MRNHVYAGSGFEVIQRLLEYALCEVITDLVVAVNLAVAEITLVGSVCVGCTRGGCFCFDLDLVCDHIGTDACYEGRFEPGLGRFIKLCL